MNFDYPMTRFLCALCLLVWGASVSAQHDFAPDYPADTTALFTELKQRINLLGTDAPENYHEKLSKVNDDRFTELRDDLRDSMFLFHPEIQQFLDEMMAEIVTANGLDVNPLVLLRRSQVPNAASYGGGIFTVNLGLFQNLETADRIAFVLCHEMAHDQLKHQRKSLFEMCERELKFDSVRKQLRRRRLAKDRRESLLTGARKSVYNSFRLKRQNELEADSLGLRYFTSLDYSMKAASSALVSLRRGNPVILAEADYKSLLQTTAYPIKEKWLEEPEQMFGGSFGSDEGPEGFWAKDSMSTHPQIVARQTELAEKLPPESVDTTKAETNHGFGLTIARETVRAQTECGAPGLAIINGLRLLANEPDNVVSHVLFGKALLRTYRSIEEHDFDEAVPPESYFWDEGSRMTIRMFHSMRKSELRRLTLAWIGEHATEQNPDEMTELLEQAKAYFAGLE